MKFVYNGELQKGVYSKDLILESIRRVGVDGAQYMAMEFTGPVIDALSVEARMTISNMAIEAGGKNGIMNPDKKVVEYLKGRTNEPYTIYTSDDDAAYAR